MVTRELCIEAKNIGDFIHTFGVSWSSYGRKRYHKGFSNLCHFRMPEKPDKALLKVYKEEDKSKKGKLNTITYSFFLDDRPLGEYVSGYYAALRPLPKFIIGCSLISSSATWACTSRIMREKRHLNTYPIANEQKGENYWIVARLLNIGKYTEEELNNFENYSETTKFLGALVERKNNESSADIDEWGLRKDGPYQPQLGTKKGYPSFQGSVYYRNKGGPFYAFIKKHEEQIVYLDIEAKPNAQRHSFTNYGVCRINQERCTGRTDNSYHFKNKDDSWHRFDEEGKFQGFFLVGLETPFNHKNNKGDHDTITVLTFIPSDEVLPDK